MSENILQFINHNLSCDVMQVTDRTHIFLLEAVRKRPQDSARHHALVHPISPSVGRDGGLPSGGHLFPPAGHLLELHQSNVSHSIIFLFFFSFISSPASSFFRIIIYYHNERFREPVLRAVQLGRFRNAAEHATLRASSCISSLRGRIPGAGPFFVPS